MTNFLNRACALLFLLAVPLAGAQMLDPIPDETSMIEVVHGAGTTQIFTVYRKSDGSGVQTIDTYNRSLNTWMRKKEDLPKAPETTRDYRMADMDDGCSAWFRDGWVLLKNQSDNPLTISWRGYQSTVPPKRMHLIYSGKKHEVSFGPEKVNARKPIYGQGLDGIDLPQ